MGQPLISQVSIWENHKAGIIRVIREALTLLCIQSNLPIDEDSLMCHSLNRELYFCFVKACRNLQLQHHKPTREALNQPHLTDPEPAERESKRPDFQWGFIDDQADESSCERNFTLECKRLGTPSSKTWKLNQNYVINGILRFVTEPHEYGKNSDDCAMIGYVQSMEFNDILGEVNQSISNSPVSIVALEPPDHWIEGGISELEHVLERSFPKSPFRLYHFWVDIRRA